MSGDGRVSPFLKRIDRQSERERRTNAMGGGLSLIGMVAVLAVVAVVVICLIAAKKR